MSIYNERIALTVAMAALASGCAVDPGIEYGYRYMEPTQRRNRQPINSRKSNAATQKREAVKRRNIAKRRR